MDKNYAKVVVNGSPISKSNFKLFNTNGRAILPNNSGKYHDRYAHYEEEIAYMARLQNPNKVLTEALIAVLKVYYKSSKRHPDTNNITKSIFDGIEKSVLIINDAQIRRLIIEEFYDTKAPRFELELFGESIYYMNYSIEQKTVATEAIEYSLPSNKKIHKPNSFAKKASTLKDPCACNICGNSKLKEELISANKGTTFFCRDCFKKLF